MMASSELAPSCRLLQTIPQAAAQLNVGRSTIYELIRSAQLEIVKIGRRTRIPSDATEKLVQKLRNGQRGVPKIIKAESDC